MCLINNDSEEGLESYIIRPRGTLENGNIFKYPQMPIHYAKDGDEEGLDNLLVVEGIQFSHDGITIVENLKSQVIFNVLIDNLIRRNDCFCSPFTSKNVGFVTQVNQSLEICLLALDTKFQKMRWFSYLSLR